MVGTTVLGPVERTSLAGLRFEQRCWPREQRDPERIALFASKYQEGGENALPPLYALRIDDDLVCYDGWHRAAAAEEAGLTEVPVMVIALPDGEDPVTAAYILAVRASTGGHKELTRAERQVGIRRLVDETDLADSAIAEIFGVSRQTVWRTRQGVADETSSEDPGERYLARSTAHDAAVRLFRGLEKVFEARGLGLWDTITGDHTGQRLAAILEEVYGDEATDRATLFANWCDEAYEILDGRRS